MELSDFLDLFLSESREHVDGMSALLAQARRRPLGQEEMNDLFRHAHSLKGMAASMGFPPIAELAHAMEDLFQRWRAGGAPPPGAALDLLQRGGDRLAALVDAVASGAAPAPESELVAALRALPEGGRTPSAESRPASEERPRAEPRRGEAGAALHLEIVLRQGTPLPAARAAVILKHLADLGRVAEVSPPPAAMAAGGFDGRFRLTLETRAGPARVRAIVLDLPDVSECHAGPVRDNRTRRDRRRSAGRRSPAEAASPESDAPASAASAAEVVPARPDTIGTVRVSTERMDRLLDGIGELILDRERLKRALDARTADREKGILENLGRTVDTLRDEVVAMRMIPFASLAPRLERMVRDLSRRLDKPVDLVVQGTEVSIDRSILEEMMDPLEHILRNSIDHGIEAAAERKSGGKPPVGRIEIVLAPRESRVVLTVEDDGRGIDPEDLRRVAVERRFLTREAAERLSEEESLMLITLPGFSTARQTTEISGRGVGMDVVLTQVRKLGGRLTVRSRIGLGTRFEMDLPPTVTMTRAFLCRAAGEIYAVPVSVVQNTIHVRRERLQESRGDQLLKRGEEMVTVLPLQTLLRTQGDAGYPPTFPALLYREGARAFALAVDEILGEEEIVVKPLKHPLEILPQYAGAAILNDGRIALILDPANLARISRAA